MISPALMLSWMFVKKREPFPEYRSPNTWSKYFTVVREIEALLSELEGTFTKEQRKLYSQYREKVLEAEREKPWQGEYAKLYSHPKEKEEVGG